MYSLFKYLMVSVLLVCVFSFALMSKMKEFTYTVKKAIESPPLNGEWDNKFWKGVQSLRLEHFMGEKPDHFPGVEVKMVYNEEAVYLVFKVTDRYIRAVVQKYQGAVYEDSCVEFFFSPFDHISEGYFNLEMNCGGQALFCYQKGRGIEVKPIAKHLFDKVEVFHSLPAVVDPEIIDQTTWFIGYRLPFEVLKENYSIISPKKGTKWRANFYKCADKTSHPHWLTWSPVIFEKPNFHLPAFFGTLTFD